MDTENEQESAVATLYILIGSALSFALFVAILMMIII